MFHLALDISNYQRELTPATIAVWKAAGVERVVVRASTEDADKIAVAEQQMRVVVDAQLELGVYEWLYFDEADPPEAQTERVLNHFGIFSPGRIWIDCEDQNPFPFHRTLQWIWWSMTHAGWAYGIYTGPWWWHQYTGDTTFFRNTPFWWAGRGLQPLIDGSGAMVQIGSMNLGGVDVDLNLYKD